jgi:hypothetical protein
MSMLIIGLSHQGYPAFTSMSPKGMPMAIYPKKTGNVRENAPPRRAARVDGRAV